MTLMTRNMTVTVDVTFESEHENSSYVDTAVALAFDLFNEGNDIVRIDWLDDQIISECATNEDTGECTCP